MVQEHSCTWQRGYKERGLARSRSMVYRNRMVHEPRCTGVKEDRVKGCRGIGIWRYKRTGVEGYIDTWLYWQRGRQVQGYRNRMVHEHMCTGGKAIQITIFLYSYYLTIITCLSSKSYLGSIGEAVRSYSIWVNACTVLYMHQCGQLIALKSAGAKSLIYP